MGSDAEVGLTAREQEVLELLSEGRANKDIAGALGCSVRTVEFHISNLLRKVGVSSRLELVARGARDVPPGVPSSNQESPLVEVRVLSGVAIAMLGDTMIVMWSASASPERWSWQCSLLAELMAAHDTGVLCLSLVLDTSTPPDRALRRQMKADFHRFGPKLRRFVVVPLGNSIWKAIVRTIGQAVLVLSRRSDRQMVVASLDQGLSRLLEAAGASTPSRSELERVAVEISRLLGVASLPFAQAKRG